MRRFVHSPRIKGGKKAVKKQEETMGNVEASCFKGTEALKPDALLEATVGRGHKSESQNRSTWHGHHHQRTASTPTTTCSSSGTSRPRSNRHLHFPRRLRGKTWHGLRRSHHHSDHHRSSSSAHATTPIEQGENRGKRRGAMRRKSGDALHKISHAVSHFFHGIEEFLFPRNPIIQTSSHQSAAAPRVRGGVLLYGCECSEEHFDRIKTVIELVRDLHGAQGLKAMGLGYRLCLCDEHKACICEDDRELTEEEESEEREAAFADLAALRKGVPASLSQPDLQLCSEITDSLRSNDGSFYESIAVNASPGQSERLPTVDDVVESDEIFCNLCKLRLYHIETDTVICHENRNRFIADGDMYEAVSRLAQEYAQDVMIEEGGLEWVTIEEDEGREPIRALINSDHPLFGENDENDRPTVMICTGRGKVRAGIFSRQHLMCSGLEIATALPLVREAVTRHLNVVIIDPNVHGDSQGFVTFQKTMDYLQAHHFGEEDQSEGLSCRDMFVLSHSASGGHIARYFLDKPNSSFLHNIRCIAFTDSTHSIQWAKADDKKQLFDMLQSKQCVYFRCAREGDGVAGDGNKWYLHPAGQDAQTDSFWKHRFGNIRTMWAGTNEHSLTNWYAHAKIWEHFDYFLHGGKPSSPSDTKTIQVL